MDFYLDEAELDREIKAFVANYEYKARQKAEHNLVMLKARMRKARINTWRNYLHTKLWTVKKRRMSMTDEYIRTRQMLRSGEDAWRRNRELNRQAINEFVRYRNQFIRKDEIEIFEPDEIHEFKNCTLEFYQEM